LSEGFVEVETGKNLFRTKFALGAKKQSFPGFLGRYLKVFLVGLDFFPVLIAK